MKADGRYIIRRLLQLIVISIPLGIVSAVYQNRFIDLLIRFCSFVGNNMPNFFAALLLVLIITAAGTVLGVLAGYLGGVVDTLIMRISDVCLAFPGLVFAMAIAALLNGGLMNAVIALAVVSWPKYARIARSSTLALKNTDFMAAAKLAGDTPRQIILRHILPNSIGTILVTSMLDIGTMMMELAGLSYLGLGAQPPTAELGNMMSSGRSMLQTYPWVIFAPGLAILLSACLGTLLLAGCSSSSDSQEAAETEGATSSDAAEEEKIFVFGDTTFNAENEEADVNPHNTYAGWACIRYGIVETLFKYFDDMEIEPWIAQDYELVDEWTWKITLREDVVSFELQRGEILGIVGESGSGKSTLLKAALGLLGPGGMVTRGDIRLGDMDLPDMPDKEMRKISGAKIGMIFQDAGASLCPIRTIGENDRCREPFDGRAGSFFACGILPEWYHIDRSGRMEPILEVRGITKSFNREGQSDCMALRDVSFCLYPGQTLRLAGESGSGKSTCAKAILHLMDLNGGSILLHGKDIISRKSRRNSSPSLKNSQTEHGP